MRLFDTHCHFETADRAEIAAQIERARLQGVERIMAVGQTAELNASAALAGELGCLVAATDDRARHAWGEIGLDYHYSPETRRQQVEALRANLEEACRRDLPVVIHTREADEDTLAVLHECPCRGIIHCFTGSPLFARKLLDLGFYVSFSGIVTFRAADNVREAARIVPDDRILIETDSPFLAPVPMRGRPNEPAFIRHTCEFLASLRKMPAEEFAELTFMNAERALLHA